LSGYGSITGVGFFGAVGFGEAFHVAGESFGGGGIGVVFSRVVDFIAAGIVFGDDKKGGSGTSLGGSELPRESVVGDSLGASGLGEDFDTRLGDCPALFLLRRPGELRGDFPVELGDLELCAICGGGGTLAFTES